LGSVCATIVEDAERVLSQELRAMLHSTPRKGIPRDSDDGLASIELDYVSFLDISRFFRRNILIMAGCFALAVVVAIGVILTTPYKYTARAQILIDPNTTRVLRDPGGSDRSLDTAQVEGQIALLRSESLAFSVLGKLKLTEDAEFRGAGPSRTQLLLSRIRPLVDAIEDVLSLGGAPPAEAPRAPPEPESELSDVAQVRTALDVFLGGLDVRRVGTSYAIDIAYTSGDPEKAARIANGVADAYIEDQLKANSQAARQSSEWLEQRLDQLRVQLNASARQLELFRTGREFRSAQQLQYGEGKPPAPAPTPGATDIGGRDRQLAPAPRDTTPRDVAPPVDPTQGRSQITLAELEATAEGNRKIYEAYQQALTEAVQRQSFPVSNARVITSATRPLVKSAPKVRLILVFAGFAGLLIGIGAAFLRQSIDHTVRSARQIKQKIGLPCLALLPRLNLAKMSTQAGLHGWGRRSRQPRLMSRGAPPISADYNFRIAIDLPFSPFTGALKGLRTSIAHSDPHHPVRCVGITSSMPREGKSLIAGNLATLYALTSARTLIIDADIHNATASRHFAPGVSLGLLEVVTGLAELDKAIVKGSGFVPDILPIAVKESAPVSYEQLTSEKMQMLLRVLRERYDMIIVDLPPVHPIIDGVAIASLLDGALIAAQFGRTPIELLAEVASTLLTAQVNVLGVIITKADESAAAVRWRKNWGYGYYPEARGPRRKVTPAE
jgi:capsular exopolysaccharide synthesis family protein